MIILIIDYDVEMKRYIYVFDNRSSDGPECLVTESVFLGESDNIGEPSVIRENGVVKTYPRAVPLKMA